MEIEYDENKRTDVLRTRGVDILEAVLIFEGTVFTAPDDRRDYAEPRFRSLGMVGEDAFVVVHTPRGDRTRIITAWLGGHDEREQYRRALSRGDPSASR